MCPVTVFHHATVRWASALLAAVALSAIAPAGAGAQTTTSDLSVTKDGPSSTTADADVTYTITVTNIGPDATAAATLADTLPAGTTFVSLTQGSGPLFTCTTPAIGGGGTVSCSIATLAAGATASSSARVGPVTSADLRVSVTAPPASVPDRDLTYTLTVTNGGPDTAEATLTNTLPGDMTFVSLNQDSGPAFSCTTPAAGAGGTVTCSHAALPPGAEATFRLVAHVPASAASGTTYTAVPTVTTSASDPNSENDAATATTTIGNADVSATVAGPATATAGDTISYALAVTNAGPDPATAVSLADTLPPDTTFVSFTQDSGPAFSLSTPGSGGTGTVSATGGALASGASATFTLVVRIDPRAAAGTRTTTATAGSEVADPDMTDNSASASTAFKAAPVRVPPGATTTPTPAVVTSPRADAPRPVVRCTSNRRIRFKLSRRHRRAPRRIAVLIDGRVVRRHGPRLRVTVSLVGRPAGRYRVTLLTRYADGRLVRREGRFATCIP